MLNKGYWLFLFWSVEDSFLRIADWFYHLVLYLSSTFDTPWKFFHISVVLTEKQLNKQLSLLNSHRSLESRPWNKQLSLVSMWKDDLSLQKFLFQNSFYQSQILPDIFSILWVRKVNRSKTADCITWRNITKCKIHADVRSRYVLQRACE